MQTASPIADPARPLVDERASPPSQAGQARSSWWADVGLAAVVAVVALLVRWPHLWTVPRFTDETLEVLHALAIVRDGARPLTNYDSYYGALYNYVVAFALWLGGESPFAPRLVVLAAGALTVAATYALGREAALQMGRSVGIAGVGSGGVVPRAVGVLAALLLATNGQHVVVISHVAWSNCLTPLLTTLACWGLLRATRPAEDRRAAADGPDSRMAAFDGRGRAAGIALALAGLALGLALQTHPLVATLLPGIAVGVLWRRIWLLRTPWPYLAAALFALGYANMLAYNVGSGFESIRGAQRMSAEYAQDQQASVGYARTAGAMLLMLGRVLGGAVDQRAGVAEYLIDPLVMTNAALSVGGVVWLARRGQPLPLLVAVSALLLLPAVNSKFGTLLTSRYLMPLVPPLFACAAITLAGLMARLGGTRTSVAAVRARLLTAALAVLAVALVVEPLLPLGRYYDRAFARTDTNERILRLAAEIAAARKPDEIVILDDGIGGELPDTGVTELRGFEHLLVFARVPYRAVRPSPGRLQDELREGATALAVLNARDASAAAARLTVTPLDSRPPAEANRGTDYRLYRLGPGRA